MISYATALRKILTRSIPLAVESWPLVKAIGRVLASDFAAPEGLPRQTYSAMDGYATRAVALRGASESTPVSLRVIGESRPGSPYSGLSPKPGDAIAIATGGVIPSWVDSIVPVEWTASELPNAVQVFRIPKKKQYFRVAGRDVRKGTVLLKKGSRLNAGGIATIAQFGMDTVEVVRRPRIGILTSGDELVPIGTRPSGDRIVATNLYYTEQILSAFGCETRVFGIAGDRISALQRKMEKALEQSDLVVTLAGVSAGKRDFVTEVLDQLGGRIVFHRVAIKPGKPTLFAFVGDKAVFGLPGNPLSAACTIEVFLKPYLRKCMGMRPPIPQPRLGRLAAPASRDRQRLTFLFVRTEWTPEGYRVHPPKLQESGNLSLLAGADALAELPPGDGPIPTDEPISLWMLS